MQNLEVGAIAIGDQVDGILAAPNFHQMVGADREPLLSIEGQPDLFGMALEPNLDLGVERQHDRAVGERMRTNRGHHDRLEGRVEDRPAGRQIVGGGSGRCGDDQAIGLETAHERAVDVHRQHQDAGKGGLVDHCVVEHTVVDGLSARGLDRDLQALPADRFRLPVKDRVEHRKEVLRRMFGEKTEGPHVDPEDWRSANLAVGHRKKGAVTSENDDQLDEPGEILALHVVGAVEHPGRFSVDHRFESEALELGQELFSDLGRLGARGFEHHSNSMNGSLRHHGPFYGKPVDSPANLVFLGEGRLAPQDVVEMSLRTTTSSGPRNLRSEGREFCPIRTYLFETQTLDMLIAADHHGVVRSGPIRPEVDYDIPDWLTSLPEGAAWSVSEVDSRRLLTPKGASSCRLVCASSSMPASDARSTFAPSSLMSFDCTRSRSGRALKSSCSKNRP